MEKDTKNNGYQVSFTGDYYTTRGFHSKVPDEAKANILNMLNRLKNSNTELDYLQVFKLTTEYEDGSSRQIIEHTQEVPKYSSTFSYETENSISEKIYVISNENKSAINSEVVTFLLASEY